MSAQWAALLPLIGITVIALVAVAFDNVAVTIRQAVQRRRNRRFVRSHRAPLTHRRTVARDVDPDLLARVTVRPPTSAPAPCPPPGAGAETQDGRS